MKAAAIRRHGGVEAIELMDLPDPTVQPGEALVEIRAAALNHLDIWVRQGGRIAPPMPHVLGSDAAGVVARLGEGVAGLNVGDEVVLNPGLSCRRCDACRRGENSLCPDFGIVGMSRPGTFAELLAVPAANLRPKPAHLDFAQAAALPLAYMTAWRMLFTRAGLRTGETVLIHGIGGGVAVAALQLAKLAGAETVVTSSSQQKLDWAAGLRADHMVNYRQVQDVAQAVRDLTAGRGADVIIDTVGAATWETNFAAIRRGGRIVHCGITAGAQAAVNIQHLYWNQIAVMGATMGSDEDFRQMLQAVAVNRLVPVVDSVLPLVQARAAAQRMEDGQQFGKIVLAVKP